MQATEIGKTYQTLTLKVESNNDIKNLFDPVDIISNIILKWIYFTSF